MGKVAGVLRAPRSDGTWIACFHCPLPPDESNLTGHPERCHLLLDDMAGALPFLRVEEALSTRNASCSGCFDGPSQACEL